MPKTKDKKRKTKKVKKQKVARKSKKSKLNQPTINDVFHQMLRMLGGVPSGLTSGPIPSTRDNNPMFGPIPSTRENAQIYSNLRASDNSVALQALTHQVQKYIDKDAKIQDDIKRGFESLQLTYEELDDVKDKLEKVDKTMSKTYKDFGPALTFVVNTAANPDISNTRSFSSAIPSSSFQSSLLPAVPYPSTPSSYPSPFVSPLHSTKTPKNHRFAEEEAAVEEEEYVDDIAAAAAPEPNIEERTLPIEKC